jgi:hypothetical protein
VILFIGHKLLKQWSEQARNQDSSKRRSRAREVFLETEETNLERLTGNIVPNRTIDADAKAKNGEDTIDGARELLSSR